MSNPAEQAAAAFKASSYTWRERAIQPPPYVPTEDQLKELWRILLERVIGANIVRGADRHLRVTRLTPVTLPRDEQRFALEVEAPAGAWQTCGIVDSKGTEANLPDLPVDPAVDDDLRAMPRAQLLAEVTKLRAQLAGDTPAERKVG